MLDRRRGNSGFTLVEMISVLLIMAIVMAVALSRGIATEDVKLQVEVDALKGYLRYAQYLAMNENDTNTANPSGTPVMWGIRVNGSSYTLIKDVNGSQSSPYSLPGESSATHTSNITATGTGIILFDDWGSPSAASITFLAQTINITANTGFIQ